MSVRRGLDSEEDMEIVKSEESDFSDLDSQPPASDCGDVVQLEAKVAELKKSLTERSISLDNLEVSIFLIIFSFS